MCLLPSSGMIKHDLIGGDAQEVFLDQAEDRGILDRLPDFPSVGSGDFVFLTGPSGSGKTTLLKIIFREIIPTEGQIVIEGVNILRIPDHGINRLRRMIGIVFQDFRLLFHRPVYENVALPLQVLGVPFKEILRLEGRRGWGTFSASGSSGRSSARSCRRRRYISTLVRRGELSCRAAIPHAAEKAKSYNSANCFAEVDSSSISDATRGTSPLKAQLTAVP